MASRDAMSNREKGDRISSSENVIDGPDPVPNEAQHVADDGRPPALKGRPFWVREVDEITLGMGEMTDEYQRFHPANLAKTYARLPEYLGEKRVKRLQELSNSRMKKWLEEGRPGWSIRDRALSNAARLVFWASGGSRGHDDDVGMQSWTPMPWTEEVRALGVRYDASPAEAARDVKAAARLFGAALVGITEMDRRFVFSHARINYRPIVFEHVDAPYSTEDKYVIPESFRWVIVLASRMSPETMYRAPSHIAEAASLLGYSEMSWTSDSLAEFIRGLGYEAIPARNGFCLTVPFAVRAGLGEMGRINRLITPEYGPMVRLSVVLTNLPLAVDRPIDAGIAEFCRHCMKCAEACPSGALSFDTDPTWEVKGEWNNPGHRAWFIDAPKCESYSVVTTTSCGICFAACPWTKKDKAWLHGLVKAVAATTSIFDGFMRQMDDFFGYGLKNDEEDQESWWDLELPEYGIDTMQGKKEV